MIAERNRSLFRVLVCSLIFMISVISIQVTGWNSVDECKDELFVKLDDDKWSDDEVESILKQENPDRLVGGVTVGQLLDFRDTTCNLEGLTSDHFYLPGHYWCEKRVWNKGIAKFDFKYQRERRKACAEKIFPLVEKALEEVSTEHKKSAKTFENCRDKTLSRKKIVPVIQRYTSILFPLFTRTKQRLRNLSDSCTSLINAMSGIDSCSILNHVSKASRAINYWLTVMETCRVYMFTRCHCDDENRFCDPAYRDCSVYKKCCPENNEFCNDTVEFIESKNIFKSS